MAHSARQKKSKLERKRVDSEMEKRRTVIFRHYKEGDVPDVQVTLQAFVSPLQALCLHDTEFASLVAATLLSSSFEWIETQKTGKTADHKETQDSVTASYMGGSMVDSVWLESSLLDSLATYTTTQLSSIRALDPAVLPLTLEYVLLYSVKSGGTVSVKELSDVSSSGSSPLLATALVDLLNGKGASQMTFSEWFSLAGALDRLDSELTLEAVRHCLQPETISTLASAKLAARSGSLHYAEECLARWGDTHSRSSLEKEYGSEENGREVHRFMEEERRRATAALLKWPSVWESVQTEQSSPLYMPALLHCHVRKNVRTVNVLISRLITIPLRVAAFC
ncbi:hypothetical protein ADEAN_000189300 [Angomonas deanei]|uniref:DNA-dependent protein kinase catalytic subunit CC5 domain-containing protein n=1 Tax=Angomonas deanei TaxID=59799 RepID=A0A7G2C6M0_9TRYP|nr:hypothetical protein ADEAN_000189300 [Angomonas deanei]